MKPYPLGYILEEHAALVGELVQVEGLSEEAADLCAQIDLVDLLAYADEWDVFCRDCIISAAARKLLALRPMNRTPAP